MILAKTRVICICSSSPRAASAFLRMDFLYHSYAIPVWAKAHQCTNSEAWVVTDFSVMIVQIKNPNKKKVVHTTLCTAWAHTTNQKVPQFFGGGIKVPLYSHTMSLVKIRLQSYFQNNMVGL
jgi:hypothetical protein